MKELQPKPCHEPKCEVPAKWHLFDLKEQPNNPIADMCDAHKDKYLSERFRAEKIFEPAGPLLKTIYGKIA